jgi:hypothetical protein
MAEDLEHRRVVPSSTGSLALDPRVLALKARPCADAAQGAMVLHVRLENDRKRRIGCSVMFALWSVLITGCGSDSDSSTPDAPPASAGPAASIASSGTPTTGDGATATGSCPISADALSTATALRWELRERRENHALETLPTVRATVCVFTAGAAVQSFGDPLVFRTDVVTGRDTAQVRNDFSDTCGSIGGAMRASGGGSVCDRQGVVVEGLKGEGDRVVLASIVNADNSTATTLTPAFTRIMEALR